MSPNTRTFCTSSVDVFVRVVDLIAELMLVAVAVFGVETAADSHPKVLQSLGVLLLLALCPDARPAVPLLFELVFRAPHIQSPVLDSNLRYNFMSPLILHGHEPQRRHSLVEVVVLQQIFVLDSVRVISECLSFRSLQLSHIFAEKWRKRKDLLNSSWHSMHSTVWSESWPEFWS